MTAIFVGFFILWLALAMWVYFDATERAKPSILWAGAVFFLGGFGVIPLILYLIFRDTGHRQLVPPGGGRRQYLYIVSFAGLSTLMVGLTILLTTNIVRVISEDAIGRNSYREALASSLAAIIVGVAVWATHWFRAERRLASTSDDSEFRAAFYLHRAYLYTVFGINWIIVFISVLWLLGGGFANALDVEGIDPEGWVPALGPALIALLVIAFHTMMSFETHQFKEQLARFETIPPPPLIGAPVGEVGAVALQPSVSPPPPPTPPAADQAARYCPSCGAPAQSDDAFCSSCGAALRPAEA
ncbi:MAG: DUF5671 domain-containing protein [Dehalococcoidia bacterium]